MGRRNTTMQANYPEFCSFKSGKSDCDMTIIQSQELILALTNKTRDDGTYELVDLHYKISVYSEVVTNQ